MPLNWIVDYNPIAQALRGLTRWKLFSDAVGWFYDLCLHGCPQNASRLMFMIGVISSTTMLSHFIFTQCRKWSWIPQHFCNQSEYKPENLVKQYGRGYAVITGCTGGIGFAFAQELAKTFDLILMDINEDQINLRIKDLKVLNPNLNTKSIVADLSTAEGISKAVTGLQTLIDRDKVEISLLINNAGISHGGKFFEIDPSTMNKVTHVNFRSAYAITQALLPHLKNRASRSAIINLSSCTGVFPSPYIGVYGSTKRLINIYSRTLARENSDKIDVLSVKPFGVTTNMMKMKKGQFMISPEVCVQGTLADLGKTDATFPGFQHKIYGTIFEGLTEKKLMQIFDDNFKATRERKL